MATEERTHTEQELDPQVVAAQRHNIERMNDQKLLHEYRLVSSFRERPPIRVAYLDTLYEEIAKRGLPVPS